MYREMSDESIEHTLSLSGSPVLMHIAYRQLKASEAILAALGEIREMLAKAAAPPRMKPPSEDWELRGMETGREPGARF